MTPQNMALAALAINTAIQQRNKILSLDGKTVICVALDGTCAFDDSEVSEIKLTEEQIVSLIEQSSAL